MRVTHVATATGAPAPVSASRYRVEFFAYVRRSGAHARDESDWMWWPIDVVYVEDAEVDEVLTWARAQEAEDVRFVLYLEQRAPDDGPTVVTRLAGRDPRLSG